MVPLSTTLEISDRAKRDIELMDRRMAIKTVDGKYFFMVMIC
jgi:hypothetical protein